MQSKFIDKEIAYDGTQLRSHWIYETFGLKGNAIVSFMGECHVDLNHLVDLEDVALKKPIFSEKMLHWIVEYFEPDLEKMVLRQRLLVSQIQQEFLERIPDFRIIRKGDDLFLKEFKLTVSIATASPVSVLIHTGVNISSLKTPVPTKGLDDFGIDASDFAKRIIHRFVEEMEGVLWARAKVSGVQ